MGVTENPGLEHLTVVGNKRIGVEATPHVVDICGIRGLEATKFSGTQRCEGRICVVIWILLLELSQAGLELVLAAFAGVGSRA